MIKQKYQTAITDPQSNERRYNLMENEMSIEELIREF